MRTELECLPCFFRQINRTLQYAGVHGERAMTIGRQAALIIEAAQLDEPPARISTRLHRLIRRETNCDPYLQIKERYNRLALDMLPGVRERYPSLTSGSEMLANGVRAAIAGNIIDFGIYDSVDLDRSIRESFLLPLPELPFAEFSKAVGEAETILYLCDNAGEIVLDRLLIDVFRDQGKHVTAVVKGEPVINDATEQDAAAAGLRESAQVVLDNGNDGIGTLLELCSDRFLTAYRSADMIISKGQANYETLISENDARIFFLFKVKCPVVARELDRANGDIVLMQGGHREQAAGH